jgi:hypothetical protein
MPILCLSLPCLERTEHAEFAFNRNSKSVRQFCNSLSDFHVVGIGCRRLRIGLERTVHHHTGEALLNCRETCRLVIAMILMQANWNMRIQSFNSLHHFSKHDIARVGARTPRYL